MTKKEIYKQVGVTALRDADGNFLPSQPIYIKVGESEVKPDTNMLPTEENTMNDVANIFADMFRQYKKGENQNANI